MEDTLRNINRIIESNQINSDNLISLFVSFRKHLERHKLKGKYKYLNLYSNWLLHDRISSSDTAFEILELLTDSVIAQIKDPSTEYVVIAINKGLGLHLLQREILSFGTEFNIAMNIFDNYEIWKRFCSILLSNLVNVPLEFPDEPDTLRKSSRRIFDSIVNKAVGSGRPLASILSIKFIVENNIIRWQTNSLNRNFHIKGTIEIYSHDIIDE